MTQEMVLQYFIDAPLDEAQKLCREINVVLITRIRLAECAPARGRPRGAKNKGIIYGKRLTYARLIAKVSA